MKFKIITLVLLPVCLFAQTVRISGVIRDKNSHREIDGVNVFVVDHRVGAVSDAAGRYVVLLPRAVQIEEARIRFQHVSYYPLETSADSLLKQPQIFMQPRIIPLQPVEIVGENLRNKIDIAKDIQQNIVLLDAKNFEMRGYVDAGDYLNTLPSIQVDEQFSGKKTLSMRGGNSDDVVVLYNGIRLNSLLDNTFDFSLVNLDNLQRFEIIKGGNTALYGPEAFSGVINIVPQLGFKHTAQLHYRMGTFDTQNIGLNLNRTFKNLSTSYSYKDGESTRMFSDSVAEQDKLINQGTHHTFDVQYVFPHSTNETNPGLLSGTVLSSAQDYENHRDKESQDNHNDLAALKFNGNIGAVQNIGLSFAGRRLRENQSLQYRLDRLDRNMKDLTYSFNGEKQFQFSNLALLAGYQYNQSTLDLLDDRTQNDRLLSYQNADVTRHHHGLVLVGKYKSLTGAGFLNGFHFDLSARHDQIRDTQDIAITFKQNPKSDVKVTTTEKSRHDWSHTGMKMAATLKGQSHTTAVEGYIVYGSNIKFPTLMQKMSNPVILQMNSKLRPLQPETVRSLELGAEIMREYAHPVISGWLAQINYFQNFYDNKFRAFATPGIPIIFYDNVLSANISGIEAKYGAFFWAKKLAIDLGLAKYQISEKAAFPFKSDFKLTGNVILDHAGFSLNVHWYHENGQTAWIRDLRGDFIEISLPRHSNMDVHFGKLITLKRIGFFLNLSGRNILNKEDVDLLGLALRDRRYYLTMGVQL